MPEELPQILESGGTEVGTVVGGARRYRKSLKCFYNAVGTGPPSRCHRQFQNLDCTGSNIRLLARVTSRVRSIVSYPSGPPRLEPCYTRGGLESPCVACIR